MLSHGGIHVPGDPHRHVHYQDRGRYSTQAVTVVVPPHSASILQFRNNMFDELGEGHLGKSVGDVESVDVSFVYPLLELVRNVGRRTLRTRTHASSRVIEHVVDQDAARIENRPTCVRNCW